MQEVKKISITANRILLFGGVYSNLQAVQKLKSIAELKGFSPNEIICNGDIVGYCAQPEECLQFVKAWGIHNIIGNVEENLREKEDDCGCDFEEGTRCDILSRQWYPYTQNVVSQRSVEWLKTLPRHLEIDFAGKKWAVVHGSPSNVSEFIFNSTDWAVKEKYLEELKVDGIIAGHSGLPFSNEKNDKYWVNPGVIGMPANDGNTAVWYAILTVENDKINVEHHSFEYDHQKANELMLEKGLPDSYAKTLLTGIWDNCDILPVEETKVQGEKKKF